VYYDGDIKKPIKFKSIGNLNTVTYNSTFYTINVTITYTSTLPQATDNIHNFRMNITGTPIGFNNVSAKLYI